MIIDLSKPVTPHRPLKDKTYLKKKEDIVLDMNEYFYDIKRFEERNNIFVNGKSHAVTD